MIGIIKRGVPQAYVRACASSETLRSVHVLRVFLRIFYSFKKGIWYVSKRAWIQIWYVPNPYPPLTVPPLWWALFGINYRFQQFSGFTPLAGQITGIGLKAINSSKKVLKITGPALFRINSVIISARTVFENKNLKVLILLSRIGKLRAWETDRKGKIPQKCLGEGAKGLLDPGSKGLRKAFCTGATPFCTGAKAVLGGAKGFSETFAPWVQKTFCT